MRVKREKRTARGEERTTTVGYRPDGTSTVSRRMAGNCPVSPVGLVLLVVLASARLGRSTASTA
jgi:hypothetical protein